MRQVRQVWALGSLSVILTAIGSPATAQNASPDLLGNIGGLRAVLGNIGITLNVTDSENLLGSLAGGIKQGATLQGVSTG